MFATREHLAREVEYDENDAYDVYDDEQWEEGELADEDADYRSDSPDYRGMSRVHVWS